MTVAAIRVQLRLECSSEWLAHEVMRAALQRIVETAEPWAEGPAVEEAREALEAVALLEEGCPGGA